LTRSTIGSLARLRAHVEKLGCRSTACIGATGEGGGLISSDLARSRRSARRARCDR
jgi:hypothetical protein